MTTRTYRAAARQLLAQARAELTAGDARQASEKGWGAAAQIVKSIAEQRGWPHHGHRHLFRVVQRLQDETQELDLRRLFDVAGALHTNFYEDWLDASAVADRLDDVELFLQKLEPL